LLPNGEFLLLTSIINIKGFDLLYYDRTKGILQRKKIIGEEDESLFRDCFGNFHLITAEYSRQLFFNSDTSFEFLPKYSRSKFDSTLAKCSLKLNAGILTTSQRAPIARKGKFFDTKIFSPFLTYDKIYNKQNTLFYFACYNKRVREMLAYEETDAGIVAQAMKDIGGHGESQEAIESKHDLFYRRVACPIYSPVYLKKDTVVIFNFQEYKIIFMDQNGNSLKEVSIDENGFSEYHTFAVLKDDGNENFYIHWIDGDKSTLSKLNIYDGKTTKKIKLEKVFGKKIFIQNEKAYYLVKERQWDDTCYLYEQRL
jgi:hypothetical protein